MKQHLLQASAQMNCQETHPRVEHLAPQSWSICEISSTCHRLLTSGCGNAGLAPNGFMWHSWWTGVVLGNSSKDKNIGALFSSQKILQIFSDSPSHQIFRRMHRVLNIDENKN